MNLKSLLLYLTILCCFLTKTLFAETVIEKGKNTVVKNFNATKYILTPPKVALKKIKNSLDQINNQCCEENFEQINELMKIKKDFEKCINKKCYKYILPVYNPFKPPLKVLVLSKLDIIDDFLLDNEKTKYDNIIKSEQLENEQDISKYKKKNKKLKKTVDQMLKNYQKRILTLKEKNKILGDNFDLAYEMLSKPNRKKLDKILE
tara:strand:- start:232 stop:846 length:615 start_codon:yes stop_codon:yes gene_type:complete